MLKRKERIVTSFSLSSLGLREIMGGYERRFRGHHKLAVS